MTSAVLSIQLLQPHHGRRVSVTTTRGFSSTISGGLISYRSFNRRGDGLRHNGIVTRALLGRRTQKAVKRETVIPDPDYRIPIVLFGFAGGLVYYDNLIPAVPVGLLALLLLVQTTRVRFVFDDEALEVKVGDELKESGENVFVGGKNRWKYSTFVNWEFWWPNFPILVYFKETQTKPEGQIHFFPIIFNGKQLYDVMVERAGPSKTSGPK
ncbi:hypothetical protein Droror1_Dr00023833 [Drosera rotundifolia]